MISLALQPRTGRKSNSLRVLPQLTTQIAMSSFAGGINSVANKFAVDRHTVTRNMKDASAMQIKFQELLMADTERKWETNNTQISCSAYSDLFDETGHRLRLEMMFKEKLMDKGYF